MKTSDRSSSGSQIVRLKDALVSTQTTDPRKTPEVTFTYIDVSSVDADTLSIENPSVINGADAPGRARKNVRRGDVLFATVRPSLRRVAIVPDHLDGAICSTAFTVLRANPALLDPSFLYYQVISDDFVCKVSELQRGSSYPAVSDSDVLNQQLPLPALDEQQRLAGILSTIQAAKQAGVAELRMATQLRSSFLASQIFTSRFGNQTKPTAYGPIPSHWDLLPIESVCELVIDCPHTTPKFLEQGVLVLRNFNFRNGDLELDRAFFTSEPEYELRTQRGRPREGDIALSREAPVGEACIIPPKMRASLGQRTMLLRPCIEIVTPEFLLGVLYAPEVQAYMNLRSSGVTAPHLNVADVRRMPIPIPPLDEQHVLSQALSLIRQACRSRRGVVACMDQLFGAALSSLVGAA